RRRQGRRARALRQGPLHPGDEDLSLPRPLDERPGQVPHPRGGRRDPQDPRSDRPHRGALGEEGLRRRGRAEGHRRRGEAHRGRRRGIRPYLPRAGPERTLHRRLYRRSWGGAGMTDVLMPALSPTMEEGTLAKWHVKVGDTVKSGDVIAEIETDKATMEVEAVDEGAVEALLVPEGTEEVKVNTPIARLRGEGEAASPAPAPAQSPAPTAPPKGEQKSAEAEQRPQQAAEAKPPSAPSPA